MYIPGMYWATFRSETKDPAKVQCVVCVHIEPFTPHHPDSVQSVRADSSLISKRNKLCGHKTTTQEGEEDNAMPNHPTLRKTQPTTYHLLLTPICAWKREKWNTQK